MKLKSIFIVLALLTTTCILVSSGQQENEVYTGHNLSFAIPEGWAVVKDVQDGNNTQIILSDNTSAIRIDLVYLSDQEINRLVLNYIELRDGKLSTEISDTTPGLWNLIYDLATWRVNGGIGEYYKNEVLETHSHFCSSGTGMGIKPDQEENAAIYLSCEEPPLDWVFAWIKPEYDNEFIGIHALFFGEYNEIRYDRDAPSSVNRAEEQPKTMQEPLYDVLTTISRGEKIRYPWEMV